MVKYIISKELQTDEINYESEDIGVFDTEEEAVQKAKTYYDELPDHEQQFYEICVWRVSGDRLDPNDWDTVEEGEEVAAFMAETNRYDDEQWDEYGNEKIYHGTAVSGYFPGIKDRDPRMQRHRQSHQGRRQV